MELVRWDPFDGMNRIQSRIDELFENNFARARAYSRSGAEMWLPPVDILENKEAYLIRVEVPGMRREDFKLEVHDGTLTLSGERKPGDLADGVELHRAERVVGKFTRSFHLPQTVRQDAIQATYRDGILEIHVPKAEEAKPRQIAISVS